MMQTSTSLLDLPDELLDQILAELKWSAPAAPALDALQFYEKLTQNTTSVQCVRLTCRRLALRASTILLPVAFVSISDPSSVDRLERIASHGAFAPYVKAVHVCLEFYEPKLTTDIWALAGYLLHVWRGSDLVTGDGGMWARVFDDWEILRSGDIGKGGPDRRGEILESYRLLRREHLEYQRRYEAQQRLCPSVVERIAKAIARMPRATRLVLDDGPDTPPRLDAVFAPGQGGWLTTPTTWATAFKLDHGTPPIDTLFSLPLAVHQAGVRLTALRIHRLRLPSHFPLWLLPDQDWDSPPPPEAAKLREACGSLRVFEFTPGYEPDCWYTDSPTHLEWPGATTTITRLLQLREALEWILSASGSLTHIQVDLQMIHGGIPYELAMPRAPWPHLQVLHQQDGSLEVTTLTRFLSATASTLAQLHLDGMFLCSESVGPWPGVTGPYSWASVLDQLRAHCRDSGGRLIVRLSRPRGAEFDDQTVSKTDMAHIRSLFDPANGGPSAADLFIQGLTTCNPVVQFGKTRLLYP